MIANLRDAPAKWTVELGTVEALVARLEAIWSRQPRHGTDDANEVKLVTAAFAESAVHEALTLVHWFQHGAIRLAVRDAPLS